MANVEIPQPKNTSTLRKRLHIFDILFDQLIEEPMYIYSETTRGGYIKHHIIYFTYEQGYYIIDKQNTYIQKLISDIMSKTTEELDLDGNTIIIYRDKIATNNWFEKRKVIDLANYIKLFKEELIQRDLMKHPFDFRKFSYYDRDEEFVLINTLDKTIKVDIINNTIDELEFSPDFFFMSKLKTKYEADINDKDWDFWASFLEGIMPNKQERRILQHWCAYALVNKFFDWQASILLYGPLANNGKSTFMKAFGGIFNHSETATLFEITERFGTEKLVNADFIIADESDAKFDKVSKLKQLLEGANTNIEGKGIAQYTGIIDSKIIIATNKLNDSLIADSGITRRIEILTTPNSFSTDEDNKLDHQLEKIKPTIFNWALSVMINMITNVSNFKQGTRQRTEKKFRENETPLANFIAIYCEKTEEAYLDEIAKAYNKYREKHQTENLNSIQIGQIIGEDKNITKQNSVRSKIHKGKSTTKYFGISLDILKINNELFINPYDNEKLSTNDEW